MDNAKRTKRKKDKAERKLKLRLKKENGVAVLPQLKIQSTGSFTNP